MKTAKDVLKSIKDNDVKYVDLRFTDPRGKWQHVTFDISMIDEEIFAEGTMFDGDVDDLVAVHHAQFVVVEKREFHSASPATKNSMTQS